MFAKKNYWHNGDPVTLDPGICKITYWIQLFSYLEVLYAAEGGADGESKQRSAATCTAHTGGLGREIIYMYLCRLCIYVGRLKVEDHWSNKRE